MSNERAIKWTPMLFTGEMIRAWQDGRKQNTRRVIKFPLKGDEYSDGVYGGIDQERFEKIRRVMGVDVASEIYLPLCPYGTVGDRLWVREHLHRDDEGFWCYAADGKRITVKTDGVKIDGLEAMVHWVSRKHAQGRKHCASIHMPQWASRITLEITSVCAERVQDIDGRGAYYEGSPRLDHSSSLHWFRNLWDSINAERGYPWQSNPWVWVIGAKVV